MFSSLITEEPTTKKRKDGKETPKRARKRKR